MRAVAGASWTYTQQHRQLKYKPCHRAQVVGFDRAVPVLRVILPYLIIKAERARGILDWYEFRATHAGAVAYTNGEADFIKRIYPYSKPDDFVLPELKMDAFVRRLREQYGVATDGEALTIFFRDAASVGAGSMER